jgi:aminoglycoside 3-N-acetyltransferase I
MDVEVRKLVPGDAAPFLELIDLFRDVLEDNAVAKAQSEHLERLLARQDFIVFVAQSAGQVIGGLTAYVLTHYQSEKPVVYLYDIAVATACQGQGIGKKLLTQLTRYCRSLGARELFVQADQEDVQAVEFYRATGGTAMQVIHFTYSLEE